MKGGERPVNHPAIITATVMTPSKSESSPSLISETQKFKPRNGVTGEIGAARADRVHIGRVPPPFGCTSSCSIVQQQALVDEVDTRNQEAPFGPYSANIDVAALSRRLPFI